MVRTLRSLLRTALILGVLVALTPCGLCHGDTGRSMSVCSMKSMTGHKDCCHRSKPVSPLCKIMDQSTTTAPAKVLDATPAPVLTVAVVPALVLAGVVVPASVVPDTSPHRAPLSLRI